ncbi:hypothetical protein BsWGS_22977 [Bradybaena similaris]
MQPLRLCVFLALIAALRAYELSQNLAELYCLFNGYFSTAEQAKKDGPSRTSMDFKAQPVLAPELSPLPVVYVEQRIRGVLHRSVIHLITEGEDGIIYSTPYNFTGNTDIRPGTFGAKEIKSLTRDNLEGDQQCKVTFERIAPFEFVMNYPDCKQAAVNGKHETYVGTFKCGDVIAVMPRGAQENQTLVPYDWRRLGHT